MPWGESPGWGWTKAGGVMIPVVFANGRKLPALKHLAQVASPATVRRFQLIRREMTSGAKKRLAKAVN